MREWFSYWRLVMSRAWVRTWAALIERDLWAVIRDLAFLAVAIFCVFSLKPALEKAKLAANVDASIADYVLWTVAGLISVVAIFTAYFLIELVFIAPFKIWQEQKAALAAVEPTPLQTQLDELATNRAFAIKNLLNRVVRNEEELDAFIADTNIWQGIVSEKIRRYFGVAEQLDFDNIGTFNSGTSFPHAWGKRHNKVLLILTEKIDRIRDLVRRKSS